MGDRQPQVPEDVPERADVETAHGLTPLVGCDREVDAVLGFAADGMFC